MDEEQKETVISYETLFDLLKREKERADLQELGENFFSHLSGFLKEKKQLLQNPSLESFDERRSLERQIDNIKKLLIDLYGKREKKIIGSALDKSRTKSTIIDTSALLKEEEQFFNALIRLFDSYRKGILFDIIDGRLPSVEEKDENAEAEVKKTDEAKEDTKKNTKMVRFMHAVPKFVGEELEEYGPFEEEDIANLPAEIADLLISKERAEEIKTN